MKKKRDYSTWINVAISWGASIVIIGVLFKILHLGGAFANYMIGIGLGIEAFLFFLMGFNQPAKEPAWERVYPELADDYSGAPSSSHSAKGPSATAALDKMFAEAQVDQAAIENLGSGLKAFNDKITAINNIADISFAANNFTEKLKTASSKFDDLGAAFEKASANLVSMANTEIDSNGYHQQVQQLTQSLSQLNSMYESELKGAAAHLQSMNKFYDNLSLTMQNFNESLDDSRIFKEEVNKLAKNLGNLNAIYGNMLNAMNQPRV